MLVAAEAAMNITLNLKPELEAGLLQRAEALGMTIEEYLVSIIGPAVIPDDKSGLSGEEKAEAFRKWPTETVATLLYFLITPLAANRCTTTATSNARAGGYQRPVTERPAQPSIFLPGFGIDS